MYECVVHTKSTHSSTIVRVLRTKKQRFKSKVDFRKEGGNDLLVEGHFCDSF